MQNDLNLVPSGLENMQKFGNILVKVAVLGNTKRGKPIMFKLRILVIQAHTSIGKLWLRLAIWERKLKV